MKIIRATVQRLCPPGKIGVEHRSRIDGQWGWSERERDAFVFPNRDLHDMPPDAPNPTEICAELHIADLRQSGETRVMWPAIFNADVALARQADRPTPPAPDPDTIPGRIAASRRRRRVHAARAAQSHPSPEEVFQRNEREHLA